MARILLAILLTISAQVALAADSPTSSATPTKSKVTRIGGVAYGPSTVTVFQNLCKYLADHGFAADFVLYSNYDVLEQALARGEIEIAWNTPLAHARYHVKKGGSQTLAMRDVDCGVRSVLIIRKDSGVKSVQDLKGKTLVLGSRDAAEAVALPMHYLAKQGVKLDDVKLVRLDEERDFRGNPCSSPQHVLAAVKSGRGQAGVITESLWKSVSEKETDLQAIWTTPEFSHCVFTASTEFPTDLGKTFENLMVKMTPNDPGCSDVLRLEGCKRWVKGSPDGFQDLIDALRTQSARP